MKPFHFAHFADGSVAVGTVTTEVRATGLKFSKRRIQLERSVRIVGRASPAVVDALKAALTAEVVDDGGNALTVTASVRVDVAVDAWSAPGPERLRVPCRACDAIPGHPTDEAVTGMQADMARFATEHLAKAVKHADRYPSAVPAVGLCDEWQALATASAG